MEGSIDVLETVKRIKNCEYIITGLNNFILLNNLQIGNNILIVQQNSKKDTSKDRIFSLDSFNNDSFEFKSLCNYQIKGSN